VRAILNNAAEEAGSRAPRCAHRQYRILLRVGAIGDGTGAIQGTDRIGESTQIQRTIDRESRRRAQRRG
jgi:hypothetical protein